MNALIKKFVNTSVLLGVSGLLAALFMVSCKGDGVGVTDNGEKIPTGDIPAYAAVQTIFNNSCTGCHGSFGGLSLEAGSSYQNLVDVASSQAPSFTRVTPGDPASSLLYDKVASDTPQVGGKMPAVGPALPQSDIDLIAAWITCGAPGPSDYIECPGVND